MRQPRRSGPSVLAVLVATLCSVPPARAASTTYTAGLNNDWSNGQNWSSGKAPAASDTVIIDRMPQVWLGAAPGAAGSLFIGLSHSASLYAATALSTGSVTLGNLTGSSGSATFLGSAARLSATGTILVGKAGKGDLQLYQAASLRGRDLKLGSAATGHGTLSVAGQSSVDLTGVLEIGGAGTGALDLGTAGRISTGSLVMGAAAGGHGSANLSGGGTLLQAGSTTIGKAGSAGLILTTGAHLQTGTLLVGSEATGSGAAALSGAGTVMTATSATIGKAGKGMLELSTGAELRADSLTLGSERGGNGQLALSGNGTALAVSGRMVVGKAGTGSAVAYSGASLSAGDLAIGDASGSSGSVIAGNDGTLLSVVRSLTVGASGTGSLALQAGADAKTGRLVIGSAAKSSGTVALSGTGTGLTSQAPVEIGRSGQGALLLTGGASLTAPALDLALLAGSSGTLSVGAAHGEIARGAGTLQAADIRFGAGQGTLVFNIGGPDYFLSSRISGKGTILADAGTIILAGDSAGFRGTTRVSGGTLQVDGRLGGTTSVTGYGTLAGTGEVGPVNVASGGRIAPAGSNAGTLSIRGDLALGSGAHYVATVGPSAGRADLLAVSGKTMIGSGAILDLVQDSAVALGRQDRIITSSGGITGRFATITSNYAFVTPSIASDGTNLLLTLNRNGSRFSSAALTRDARIVADAGETLSPESPLYRQMVSLSETQAATTFSDMAGTIHASPANLAFDVGRFARAAAVERASLSGGAASPSGSGMPSAMTAYVSPGYSDAARAFAAVLEEEKQRGPVGWARAYGGYSTHAGEGGDRIGSTGGLLFGWDSAVGDDLRLGIIGGIGTGHVRESDKLSTLSSRDYTLGLYGGTELGPVSLRFGTTYVHQDIESSRTTRFAGLAENLDADYAADAVQAYAEIGHAFRLEDTEIEPFANLALTWQRSAGFAETGGASALTVSAAESIQAETLVGLRAAHPVELFGAPARVRGMLGWNHAFDARGEGPLFSFAGSNAFSLEGAETGGDSLAVEAGLDFTAADNGMMLGMTYGGNFSADAQSHLVKLTLSRQF